MKSINWCRTPISTGKCPQKYSYWTDFVLSIQSYIWNSGELRMGGWTKISSAMKHNRYDSQHEYFGDLLNSQRVKQNAHNWMQLSFLDITFLVFRLWSVIHIRIKREQTLSGKMCFVVHRAMKKTCIARKIMKPAWNTKE